MRFEREERVRYAKNPLVEVICDLRFPIQLALQQSLPVDFQTAVSDKYPYLQLAHEFQFEYEISPDPTETAAIQPQNLKQTRITAYEFLSLDKQSKISLSDQWIRLSTTRYDSWESFEHQIIDALHALSSLYNINLFTRASLRYRDLIDRKYLGCESEPWTTLIRPEMLGPIVGYGIPPDECEGFQQSLRVKLEKGNVGISHALIRHSEGHTAFLIDADFSIDDPLKAEVNDVANLLQDFNIQAGGLFRATISDRLHELLEPSKIGAE